jgi:hypothetical protein
LQLLYLKLIHSLQFPDVADEAAEEPSQFRPTLLQLGLQHLVVVPERLCYSTVKFWCGIDLAKEICSSASELFLSSILLGGKLLGDLALGDQQPARLFSTEFEVSSFTHRQQDE